MAVEVAILATTVVDTDTLRGMLLKSITYPCVNIFYLFLKYTTESAQSPEVAERVVVAVVEVSVTIAVSRVTWQETAAAGKPATIAVSRVTSPTIAQNTLRN